MLPEAKRYALITLESNPNVMAKIVDGFWKKNDFWDFKPFPDRFSMRFVLAHLADWDPIFIGRVELILLENTPELPAFDEGRMAVDNDYEHQDPAITFRRWLKNRAALVTKLSDIPSELHDRQGMRSGQGLISISEYMAMISLHDSYHINQAVDYLARWKGR